VYLHHSLSSFVVQYFHATHISIHLASAKQATSNTQSKQQAISNKQNKQQATSNKQQATSDKRQANNNMTPRKQHTQKLSNHKRTG
jgi:hypothetical protein